MKSICTLCLMLDLCHFTFLIGCCRTITQWKWQRSVVLGQQNLSFANFLEDNLPLMRTKILIQYASCWMITSFRNFESACDSCIQQSRSRMHLIQWPFDKVSSIKCLYWHIWIKNHFGILLSPWDVHFCSGTMERNGSCDTEPTAK